MVSANWLDAAPDRCSGRSATSIQKIDDVGRYGFIAQIA
jgi:hypothetical protein